MTHSLFIADLHLSNKRPLITQKFITFLTEDAPKADHLYILGDLFDVWIGDDDTSAPIPEITHALASLKAHNTSLSLQHGNRDFLLGSDFCHATHATLLADITCITIADKTCLLMHGDQLCTDDIAYQAAKKTLRHPSFIQDFLSKPLTERASIAQSYRAKSGESTSLLAQDIMDVNTDTLIKYIEQYQANIVIHGHTHRPDTHQYEINNQKRYRYVLADWSDHRGGFLMADQAGIFKHKTWG